VIIPSAERIRAAHAACVEQMRRSGSLATPVPTTNDLVATFRLWGMEVDRAALVRRVAGLGLKLADQP
jgi:hypothetical protein